MCMYSSKYPVDFWPVCEDAQDNDDWIENEGGN